MIGKLLTRFDQMGIFPKLLISFLFLSIIPLVILGYFANKNLNNTGLQAVERAEEMGVQNLKAAEEIGKTSIEDSVSALDKKSTDAIELRTVELAARIADFLYERDKDMLILSSLQHDQEKYRRFYSTSKRDVVITEPALDDRQHHPISPLQSSNPENRTEWRHRPPQQFKKLPRPLYKEITFVDLNGVERIKITDGKVSKSFSDISKRENTYCRAEDYFTHVKDLKRGEIYVSEVIGEYVPGWLSITPEGIKVKRESAYAGKENPHGRKFGGIIRWATPVYGDLDRKIGYATMALDHTHIMEFTDHVIPTDERFTVHSDGGSGNYAFIWDHRDRCIAHARDFFICGYDASTGKEIPGWISQSTYDKYLKSGLTLEAFTRKLPSFQEFTQKKPSCEEQIKSGRIPLDCRILDNAPQCQGWHEGTEDGGSGSFLILWSGLWKLTTYAAIPYYTGMYGKSKRGFGYVTIGANVDDFHKDANITKDRIEKAISREGQTIIAANSTTRDLIRKSAAHNRRIITIIAVLAALAVIGASLIISFNITRPLKRLTEGAIAMRSGNYDQYIEATSKDEIGQLAHSFNEMAKAVSEVDKMKSDFVTIASHELRTPIQAMLLGVSGILGGFSGEINDEVRQDLELAKIGIERLMRLVSNFLDLSRIESRKIVLNKAETEVHEIVDAAVSEVLDLANAHGHTIVKQIPPDIGQIRADKDHMVQVVINCLSNSIKYSPDGGMIIVKGERKEGEMVFFITDNGYGIPSWAQKEIFKKFFQADSIMSQKVGGSGLGLTITKEIIENHGGSINCKSPVPPEDFPGLPLGGERKGAVFTILLPTSSS
jgi:signal transduction histidine kinase